MQSEPQQRTNTSSPKTGLFFGSFNPVHTGHLIIANWFIECTDIRKIRFVVSPHNPLKEKGSLLAFHHRYEMVKLAIEDNERFSATDIERHLPQPSYTIDTLARLKELFPENNFALIAGSDQLTDFHKWKNPEAILTHYPLYIYRRPGHLRTAYDAHPGVRIFDVPLIDLSSTYIRQLAKEGKGLRYLLPERVTEYIKKHRLYR